MTREDFDNSHWPHLRKRPGMYLRLPSITALDGFLLGIDYVTYNYRLRGIDPFPLPYEFRDWVAYRLRLMRHCGWKNLILLRFPEEDCAIERFFILLEECLVKVPIEIAYCEDYLRPAENGAYRKPTRGRLRLLSYTDDPGFFVQFPKDENGFVELIFLACLNDLESRCACDRSRLEICDSARFARVVYDEPQDEHQWTDPWTEPIADGNRPQATQSPNKH
jgi:hypothetical protein